MTLQAFICSLMVRVLCSVFHQQNGKTLSLQVSKQVSRKASTCPSLDCRDVNSMF